jgi:hypothetical protein
MLPRDRVGRVGELEKKRDIIVDDHRPSIAEGAFPGAGRRCVAMRSREWHNVVTGLQERCTEQMGSGDG